VSLIPFPSPRSSFFSACYSLQEAVCFLFLSVRFSFHFPHFRNVYNLVLSERSPLFPPPLCRTFSLHVLRRLQLSAPPPILPFCNLQFDVPVISHGFFLFTPSSFSVVPFLEVRTPFSPFPLDISRPVSFPFAGNLPFYAIRLLLNYVAFLLQWLKHKDLSQYEITFNVSLNARLKLAYRDDPDTFFPFLI